MKTKVYNLNYSWYEEYSIHEFTHPDDKSKEQFEADVILLANKYTSEHIEKGGATNDCEHVSWIGNDTFVKMLAEKMPELGYVPIEETIESINFGLWGSGIIDSEEDGKDLEAWIGKDNIDNIIKYNQKIAAKE